MTAAAGDRLLSLPRLGEGAGLHRMLWFLDSLPEPGWVQRLDAIKITGSKGKGSTSALTAEILKHLGISAGLYTSPHLMRFNERIQVDGEPISDSELEHAADWVLDKKTRYESDHPADRVSAFETFTAAALYHFCSKGVATVVSEAGLGGRYDSTRIIPGAITALTSVELEHTHILGPTHEMIAYDKIDLCRSGGSLVVGRLDDELLRRVRAYCRVREIQCIDAMSGCRIEHLVYAQGRMCFDLSCAGLEFRGLTTRLVGEHQAHNACVAVHLADLWIERNRPDISRAQLQVAVRAALDSVTWPGRLEYISTRPEIIVDIGHTPRSAGAAAVAIRQMLPGRRILLVTGVSGNKDIKGVLSELVPIADSILCTRAYHRGAPVEIVADVCDHIRPGAVWKATETIEDAMRLAVKRAADEGYTVIVAGGLFLAMEAKAFVEGRDPQSLHFF